MPPAAEVVAGGAAAWSTTGGPLITAAERVIVIDEDLGLSGSGGVARSGFARLTAEVALAHVGLVLGLEVSRLARNNAEW
jgi:DNA invertase Pin-like site-specific DNA recombinase